MCSCVCPTEKHKNFWTDSPIWTKFSGVAWPLSAVWLDWAIYWTLGNFSRHVAKIDLPKSPTFLGNFCKGVKMNHFSSEIIFLVKSFLGNFYRHLAIFFLVTLIGRYVTSFNQLSKAMVDATLGCLITRKKYLCFI